MPAGNRLYTFYYHLFGPFLPSRCLLCDVKATATIRHYKGFHKKRVARMGRPTRRKGLDEKGLSRVKMGKRAGKADSSQLRLACQEQLVRQQQGNGNRIKRNTSYNWLTTQGNNTNACLSPSQPSWTQRRQQQPSAVNNINNSTSWIFPMISWTVDGYNEANIQTSREPNQPSNARGPTTTSFQVPV
ncbi:hypothetical protein Pcinc_028128 [Petrolisthes cinctipes]|uniref:Uncharacterized protein n=1 Tax=Petrolisthes cinctipes TaxID=88211 RepID=A0AAE1F3R6_PETCI|nr:hypothetical protein Pcinc_028128 [Petrolisthes cinctipes]